jgi:serine/threonine protein kinase/Tol biopolymer transport system component
MALKTGSTLGQYEILSSLGAGGMGEVYRARDTQLGREVAIKLLLDEVADDADRLARFEREARTLASLNHPNIATLHGFDRDGSTRFLVMELVEGETLADRISRGALPLDEALRVFLEIAIGLEAAHERGVVHRDLKPANIKAADEGAVKILDFGLAKALAEESDASDPALSHSPTLTLAATQRGEILGTAAYMSPEQASGKPVDKRTDVWAFGVCLYEALTGRRAFDAEDAPNTLAAVLRDDIDLEALPPGTPRPLRRLLERCLVRDRRHRLHDIADARLELEASQGWQPDDDDSAAIAGHASTPKGRLRPLLLGGAGLAIGVLGTALVLREPEERSAIGAPSVARFAIGSAERLHYTQAISPDGSRICFTDENGLSMRDLDSAAPEIVPSTRGAERPFFSPDSAWVGFQLGEALWKMRAEGGEPEKLTDLAHGRVTSASWGADGDIVIVLTYGGDTSTLLRVSDRGGEAETLRTPDRQAGEVYYSGVTHLPGDRGILLSVDGAPNQIQLLRDGSVAALAEGAPFESNTLAYSPTGHLLYSSRLAREIWAVGLSLDPVAVTTPPFLVARDAHSPTVTRSGSLLARTVEAAPKQLVWVSRSGEVLEPLGEEQADILNPRVSADGRHVVFTGNPGSDGFDVFVQSVARGTRTRLTRERFLFQPTFTADSTEVVVTDNTSSVNANLIRLPRDGSAEPRALIEGHSDWSADFSRDGRHLVFYRIDPETRRDLYLLDLEAGGEPTSYLKTPYDEIHPRLSPNGRHIVYQSNDQGRWNIYLETFPERTQRWQLSPSGGEEGRWSPLGDEVFYLNDNELFAVPISLGAPLQHGAPERLFSGDELGTDLVHPIAGFEWHWDVGPRAERFVVTLGINRGRADVVLTQNWHLPFEAER